MSLENIIQSNESEQVLEQIFSKCANNSGDDRKFGFAAKSERQVIWEVE